MNVRVGGNTSSYKDKEISNGTSSIGLVRSPRRQLPLTDIPSNVIGRMHNTGSLKKRDYFTDATTSNMSKTDKRLSQGSAASKSKRKAENRIGPWRLGRTLGRGSTGRVRLAKHCQTGQLAAIKIIPKVIAQGSHGKARIDDNGLPYGIEREIIIMKLISHPNIMALYDVWENTNELYLVLEYIEGGELFDFLVHRGRLTEHEAAHYFGQIIDAVAYCHKFQICHRDLKPENILLDRNHNIKLADFGMAALETRQKLLETSCGSPHYAAPEIVSGKSYHGSPSDVWSCGVILFAMLTGHLPFDDPNIRNLLLKVQTGKYRLPSYLSIDAKDLIQQMLRVNPDDRIPIEEISHHPFILKYGENSTHNARSLLARQLDNLDVSAPILHPQSDILHNLETLWHGIARDIIIEKLRSAQANTEKMFYYLLLKYKEAHSTNNNGRANFDPNGSGSSDSGSEDYSGRSDTQRLKQHPEKQYQRPVVHKKQIYKQKNKKHDVAFPVGFTSKHRSSSKLSLIVHSASTVTTTIQDENGKVLQQQTKKILIPSKATTLRKKQIDQPTLNTTKVAKSPLSIRALGTPKMAPISCYSSVAQTDNLSEFKYLFGSIYNDPDLATLSANTPTKKENFKIYQDDTESKAVPTLFKANSAISKNSGGMKACSSMIQSNNSSSYKKIVSDNHRLSQHTTKFSPLPNTPEIFEDTKGGNMDNYVSVLDPKVHKPSDEAHPPSLKPFDKNNFNSAKIALKELGIKGDHFHLTFNQGKEEYGKSLHRKSSLARSIRSNSMRNLSMILAEGTQILTVPDNKNNTLVDSQYLFSSRENKPGKSNRYSGKGNSMQSSKTNNTNVRSSFEYSFLDDITSTVHNAVEVPILNSSEDHLVRVKDFGLGIKRAMDNGHAGQNNHEDKFADAEEDAVERNFLNDEQNASHPLKVHQRVDSNASEKCIKKYPNIRCSLMNGSNYEFGHDDERRLSLTPEKAKIPKPKQDLEDNGTKRESIFADPEESNVAINPTSATQNITIFDEENEMDQGLLDGVKQNYPQKEVARKNTKHDTQGLISPNQKIERNSTGLNTTRMSWLSTATEKASTLLHHQVDTSTADVSLKNRNTGIKTSVTIPHKELKKTEGKSINIPGTVKTNEGTQRPNWFRRIFGSIRTKQKGRKKGNEKRHSVSGTSLRRKNTVKLHNLFAGITNQFYFEADYLTSEEAESGLTDSCNDTPKTKVSTLPGKGNTIVCTIVRKQNNKVLSIRATIEEQIGGEYGFGGCFIHIAKVKGSTSQFRSYCKLVNEKLKRLDARKMENASDIH